ncbi:SWIM zinc finger protein [Pelotomaculum schinkii]|uniref:SWIM zinc finger protein n=1 Tax=Pelotomaculum schinkii TaxID=78350 RepID=A0A4Y7RG43_9FIRM|nr:SWIM zinc finger family protein [Pelotomaculum schinkii]TEB07964.1 SWIM zinc finger protein [Pelotomaculum schinkii]
MKDDKILFLTEEQIRKLADGSSFRRGIDYYESGNISNPVRQGKELRGECYGSRDQPYRVRVVLKKNGIEDASCSCPRGGFCKHIVALLLQYIHEPDSFEDVASLNTILARLSKEELIALIGELVLRDPSLASVVGLAAGTSKGQLLDVAALNREVQRTLRRHDPYDIETDLRQILQMAERLAEKEDWRGAGMVYAAVLDAMAQSYPDELQEMDESGDIACIAQDCEEGLKECLESGVIDKKTKRGWLITLLDAELADIEMGGIDFAPEVGDVILRYADKQDWEQLAASIRERIPKSDRWQRECLVNLLAGWEEQHGKLEQARQLVREFGTLEQQIFLKVEEGRPEEAMTLAKQHLRDKPGAIKQLADALVEASAGELAVSFLTELVAEKAYSGYLEWLVAHHRQDKPEVALAWQRQVFQQLPTLKSFQAMRQLGEQVGVWPQARTEALETVTQKKNGGLLIEIALDEGDVARALELLPQVVSGHSYKGEVAKAAESEHPREAIKLYQGMAEEAIAFKQTKKLFLCGKVVTACWGTLCATR